MRIQVGFSRIINLNVPDFIFMMRQKLFNENFKLIFIVIDTAEMWPPLLSVRLSGEVRGELHKRKSLACRLNTDCFRVALPRMGHPGSRDFTFQYLQLPQIFTTTECPDIHVPQSRDPAFFSSRQSDHTGLPHCSKSLRDKTIFIFKKNSTLL